MSNGKTIVAALKTLKARPPMPWWSTRETTEEDLRAMHAYLPPDKAPKPPYVQYPTPAKENR